VSPDFIEGVVEAGRQPPYGVQKCGHLRTVPTHTTCPINSQNHSKPFKMVLKGSCDFIEVFEQGLKGGSYDVQKCGHLRAVPTHTTCSINSQNHSRPFKRVLKGFCDLIEVFEQGLKGGSYDVQKCGHLHTFSTAPTDSINSQNHSKPFIKVLRGFCDFIEVFEQW
jgi:hypothetical protein